MAKLTFRFVFFIMLLFLGILTGMNIAEKGIYSVAGNPDLDSNAFQVVNNPQQVEVKVMGKTYEIEKKQVPPKDKENQTTDAQKTGEVKVSKDNLSLMSKVGNKLGNFFQAGAEKGLNLIAGIID